MSFISDNVAELIPGRAWFPLEVDLEKGRQRQKNALVKRFQAAQIDAVFSTEILAGYRPCPWRGWPLQIAETDWDYFRHHFQHFFTPTGEFVFDNLINVCMMVKDAGPGFADILRRNLPYMDYCTILDTGSTDGTVETVFEILKEKDGQLVQEPFINFRDSRNRLLDIAGDRCAFNIMLDDTYVLNGRIREFLEFARGDDVADSYSIVISDSDTMYTSNRITKPERNLRYINVIHEIIQQENNTYNVNIPYAYGYIEDVQSVYMSNRTKQRKESDIALLEHLYRENPYDSRTLYYLADSYICLKEWKKALHYFELRVNCPEKGFEKEYQDALYYIATISYLYTDLPWAHCHELFMNAYNSDPTRADTLYIVGKHYKDQGNVHSAFMYLHHALRLGFPLICMSVRKKIYQYHIPAELMTLCYDLNEYEVGERAARQLVENGYKDEANTWLIMYQLLNVYANLKHDTKQRLFPQRTVAMVCSNGWGYWTGATLYEEGLGGSETFAIRYAETMVQMGLQVIVFSPCEKSVVHNGVTYHPVNEYVYALNQYVFDIVIINRAPELIPVTRISGIDTIWLVLHDMMSEGHFIPQDTALKGILCLSEFHKHAISKLFSSLSPRLGIVHYGIDCSTFPPKDRIPHRFIYSSFPNRGLLQTLQMFSRIVEKYPDAHLDIFCDFENTWLLKHHAENTRLCLSAIEQLQQHVTQHGWVNQETLRNAWSRAHIWLYPCTFEETCCLTAYEAAASETLVISNDLGALKESVGDRGIVVPGNAQTDEWQSLALQRLFEVLDDPLETVQKDCIQRNLDWVVRTRTYEKVVREFVSDCL